MNATDFYLKFCFLWCMELVCSLGSSVSPSCEESEEDNNTGTFWRWSLAISSRRWVGRAFTVGSSPQCDCPRRLSGWRRQLLLETVLLWDVLSTCTFTILNLLKDFWDTDTDGIWQHEACLPFLSVCAQCTNRVFVLLVLLRQWTQFQMFAYMFPHKIEMFIWITSQRTVTAMALQLTSSYLLHEQVRCSP